MVVNGKVRNEKRKILTLSMSECGRQNPGNSAAYYWFPNQHHSLVMVVLDLNDLSEYRICAWVNNGAAKPKLASQMRCVVIL